MLDELKKRVCDVNLGLAKQGLVFGTWGNASGIDRPAGQVVIKPSGVPYDRLRPKRMVVVALGDGAVVEGELKPSSDTPTHLALYRAFETIGGVVHTHSLYATAWAQTRREIIPMGTTHADYFRGPVPCTRGMTAEEIRDDYEANVGKVIAERVAGLAPGEFPGVLVADHGPFSWGRSPEEALENAAVLERLAQLASETLRIEPYPRPIPRELLDRHFLRKHGPGRYYGQQEPAD